MLNLFLALIIPGGQNTSQEVSFGELPPDIDCGNDFFTCIAFFFGKFLQVIVNLALFLAAIFIAWGGIEYIVFGNDENKRKTATKRLIWGTLGLVVALLAYAFVIFLEGAISRNRISLLNNNFVYAQQSEKIEEPKLPEGIECGGRVLPSVLKSTESDNSNLWWSCILYYFQKFIAFLYGIALALGVFFLVWAGILYITQPEKTKDIHPKLFYGIFGIVIAIFSWTIVKIINFFFFNLN